MRKELYKGNSFMSKYLNCIVEPFLTIEPLENGHARLTVHHVPICHRAEQKISEEIVPLELVKYATKGFTKIK